MCVAAFWLCFRARRSAPIVCAARVNFMAALVEELEISTQDVELALFGQPPVAAPEQHIVAAAEVAAAAVSAEACVEASLPTTVKRKHMHYTHVRTFDENHIQPEALTRAEFYEHLEQCYKASASAIAPAFAPTIASGSASGPATGPAAGPSRGPVAKSA